MAKGNYSYGMYLLALGCGLVSGLCFSKAAYYRGQQDAYTECGNLLKNSIDKLKKELEKEEESE